MIKPLISEQAIPGEPARKGAPWFQIVLALITLASLGWVTLPVFIPLILGNTPSSTALAYSHVVKASAFVAFLLLWISMLAGLSITSKAGRKLPGIGMSWSFGLHRFTTLLGLGFAAIHAITLLGLDYMGFTLGQLLIPFIAGSYRTQWLGLGQVALYALCIVAFSFYARNRLGVRTWRLIHSLSFSLFLMALVHGLQSGSDTGLWWSNAIYWGSASSITLGCIYRMLASRMGQPRHKAAGRDLIAVGGRAQALPIGVLSPEQ